MSKDKTSAKSPPTTLICIPAMDMVPTQFMECLLGIPRPEGTMIATAKSSLIYDARNLLSKMAMDKGYERIMWLDSDMVFDVDIMERLGADLDAGCRFVAGLAFTRKNPIRPVIYSETGYRDAADVPGKKVAYTECILDYPKDQLFEIAATGLAACMMETSVVKEVFDAFGSPFSPEAGFGEDLSFCRRLTQLGIPMHCDSRVKLGHVGAKVVREQDYLKGVVL